MSLGARARALGDCQVPDIFGVGPVIAAMVVGITGECGSLPNRGPFRRLRRQRASRSVVRPHKVFRISRRGNRQLNHAIHTAAVTQIRNRDSDGYADGSVVCSSELQQQVAESIRQAVEHLRGTCECSEVAPETGPCFFGRRSPDFAD